MDPNSNYHFIWLMLVTVTILYDMVFVICRGVFWELNNSMPIIWTILDCICDVIYILDTVIHVHEGFMDHGVIIYNYQKARENYFKMINWKLDFLSLLPTDLMYFWWLPDRCSVDVLPCPVIVRVTRLFRIPRMMEFWDCFGTKTYYPKIFRICKLLISIFMFIHWNSCAYFAASYVIGFGSDKWVYSLQGTNNTLFSRQYIYSFYWSTITLTTIGEMPPPQTTFECVFVVINMFASVIILVTLVGNITHIFMICEHDNYQRQAPKKMDGVKDASFQVTKSCDTTQLYLD